MSDDQSTRQHDTTRRATLRSLAAAATATPLALGVAAAESGDSRFHDPEQAPELPHPDATLYKYDDSLRKIISHPCLLALSEQAIDGHFDSSNLKGRSSSAPGRTFDVCASDTPLSGSIAATRSSSS